MTIIKLSTMPKCSIKFNCNSFFRNPNIKFTWINNMTIYFISMINYFKIWKSSFDKLCNFNFILWMITLCMFMFYFTKWTNCNMFIWCYMCIKHMLTFHTLPPKCCLFKWKFIYLSINIKNRFNISTCQNCIFNFK